MTVEELLAQLEQLTHAARVQTMIALGRRSDEESKALIAALFQGGFFERFMALYSCFGSRDSAQVRRALDDASQIIRGLAIRLLPLVCTEAELHSVLEYAPAHVRRPILWKLHQQGQQHLIDTVLESLIEQHAAQWYQLLPLGSPALVERYAAAFRQQATKAQWKRLAHLHPGVTLAVLQAWASDASTSDDRLISFVNTLLPALLRADAQGTLALVMTLRRTAPLKEISERNLRLLVNAHPQAMAELIWAEHATVQGTFSAIVPWLSVEQLLTLYAEDEHIIGWSLAWARYLTPEQRLATYTAGRKLFSGDRELADAIGLLLPRAQREPEARKALASFQGKPNEQYDYMKFIKFLPWDEALPLLEPSFHVSDVYDRQQAIQTLIEVVSYERSRLPDALALLRTYRAEHDNVRRAFLESLETLPLGIWRDEHLADLAEIIRHGLNDVGLSPETLHVIINLLLKLLPAHSEWTTAQLATVLQERGVAAPRGRGNNRDSRGLSDEQLQRLLAALLPVFQTWLEREQEGDILKAIQWFAGYKTAFATLLPLLTDVLRQTRSPQIVELIFSLIARQSSQSFQTLIPALLQEDQSWITFPIVSAYLHRHRQDLLPPFLAFQPYAGRWGTGRKSVLLPIPCRFTAPPAQQERYAATLLEIIQDDAQGSQMQIRAVMRLSQLPAIPATRLIALASDTRSVVRTPALFALGRLDTDEGLPALIAALQDARARIAVHPLRTFLRRMPPAQALEIARSIPIDRVTVAKERVRLIAEIRSEEAHQELLALEQRDLHQDVRLALLRTFVRYLDRPETWAVFERAAQAPNITMTADVLPDRRSPLQFERRVQGEATTIEQHLLRVARIQLDHPDPEMQQSAIRYCSRFGFKDEEGLLLPRLLAFLSTLGVPRNLRSLAIEATFSVFVEGQIPLLLETVRAMLPDRRVLDEMEDELMTNEHSAQAQCKAFVGALLPVLAEDPMTVLLRIRLTCTYLPVDQLAAFFQALAEHNELYAEALMKACETLAGMAYRNRDAAQLEQLEITLAASEDERLRRLAFALLEGHGRRSHGAWNQQRLERLRGYRADPSVLVAAAAQWELPVEELEDGDEDEDDEDEGEDENE